jgi:hypothetical protein
VLTLCVHAPDYLDLLDQVTSPNAAARPSAKAASLEVCNIIANMTTVTLALPTHLSAFLHYVYQQLMWHFTACESAHPINSYRNAQKYFGHQE